MYKKIIEFLKFSIIGALMTILSLFLFWLLMNQFHINYIISNIISYSVSVLISFYLNQIFTFNVKNINKKNQFKKIGDYFLMKLFLLLLDSASLFMLVQKFFMDPFYSKIFLTLLFLAISYPLSKFIIKSNSKEKEVI